MRNLKFHMTCYENVRNLMRFNNLIRLNLGVSYPFLAPPFLDIGHPNLADVLLLTILFLLLGFLFIIFCLKMSESIEKL